MALAHYHLTDAQRVQHAVWWADEALAAANDVRALRARGGVSDELVYEVRNDQVAAVIVSLETGLLMMMLGAIISSILSPRELTFVKLPTGLSDLQMSGKVPGICHAGGLRS